MLAIVWLWHLLLILGKIEPTKRRTSKIGASIDDSNSALFAGAKGNTTKLNQPTMTTAFGGGPAPFSFHCIICFEAFNLEDRPPVILPCGHTYVCAPCSKRLDKCMECRTSLFIKPDDVRRNSAGHGTADGGFAASGSGAAAASAADTESMPSWYRPLPGRAHSRDATYQLKSTSPHTQAQRKQANPAKAAEPIPLPMPKNLVMMALMEAAEEKKRLEKISNRVQAKAAAERNEKRPANDGKDRPPETVSIAAAGLEGIEKTDESFQKVVGMGATRQKMIITRMMTMNLPRHMNQVTMTRPSRSAYDPFWAHAVPTL